MRIHALRFLILGFLTAICHTAVGQEGRPLSIYAKLYEALSDREETVEESKYVAEEFVTNWVVRRPGTEKMRLTWAPDQQAPAGVRLHGSQIIIQLKPATTPDQLDAFVNTLKQKYTAKIDDIIPEVGVIVARLSGDDQGPGLVVPQNVANAVSVQDIPSVRRVMTLQEAIRGLSNEPSVLVAAPNTFIGTSIIPAAANGTGKDRLGNTHSWDWTTGPGGAANQGRDGNWGLKRMAFPAAWNFRLENNGVHVGILDSGFAAHQDLAYVHSPVTTEAPDDHGMHVAGIVGATWSGNVGINGALPSVKITSATMQNIDFARTNLNSPGISLILTDVMSNIVKFIIEHPDVKVINLSLGYNWVRNEGVDPNTDQDIQKLVRDHGVIMRTIAELANERGIIIVSAAGNDSRPGQLPSPVEAQFASPFNWAALNKGFFDSPAQNVVVVESIGRADANGADPISSFSNVHGCLSAPGEDILSLVATSNPFRSSFQAPVPSNSTYAAFSGTSMAAPHVAGLIGLMYAYNPNLKHTEVLEILDVVDNNRPATTTPAPTINAFDALVACRDDSLKGLADLDQSGKVDMADFNIFRQHLKQIMIGPSSQDLNGDGTVSANENIYPRADLNGDGQLSRDRKRSVKGHMMTDLDVMKSVWEDSSVTANALDNLLDQ